jgi:hypothetical protein
MCRVQHLCSPEIEPRRRDDNATRTALMDRTVKQMIEESPAIKMGTLAYSNSFMLTSGGVLNIYDDLTEADCLSITSSGMLKQIQFARSFNVVDDTFNLINSRLLPSSKNPKLRVVLNGHDAVNDLKCLRLLTNLRSLTVDMFKNDQLKELNQYAKLEVLGLGGHGISVKPIAQQTNLEELFLFGKLKDVESISAMKWLKKVTFSQITLKNLDFLADLEELRELSFMLGGASNYEQLPNIGKIESLSFGRVRQLTIEHLQPINRMKYLKKLSFDTQAHLTDLDWLTDRTVKTEVINCKNYKA